MYDAGSAVIYAYADGNPVARTDPSGLFASPLGASDARQQGYRGFSVPSPNLACAFRYAPDSPWIFT